MTTAGTKSHLGWTAYVNMVHVSHLVFVYGTLMKGELHHSAMSQARFLRSAETRAEYELVQVDYYPAMLSGGTKRVIGELYEVDAPTLQALDELEAVPHEFERQAISLADGTEAFTYLMPRERAEGAAPIPSGYFRMRTAPPKRR